VAVGELVGVFVAVGELVGVFEAVGVDVGGSDGIGPIVKPGVGVQVGGFFVGVQVGGFFVGVQVGLLVGVGQIDDGLVKTTLKLLNQCFSCDSCVTKTLK
jgi:hypothetical protein